MLLSHIIGQFTAKQNKTNKKLEFEILTVLCRTENERKFGGLQTEHSVIEEPGSTHEDKQDASEHRWPSLFNSGCQKSRRCFPTQPCTLIFPLPLEKAMHGILICAKALRAGHKDGKRARKPLFPLALPFPEDPLPQHPGPLTLGSLKLGQGGRLPCSPQRASPPAQPPQDQGHQSLGCRQRFKPFPTDRAPPMGCPAPGLSGSTGFPDSFYGCSPSRANPPSPAVERRRDLRALFVLGPILWEARVGRGRGGCDSAHASLTSGDRGAQKRGPALAGDREF